MTGQGGAPLVLLAAGGTGGHLFPAEALAHALAARGVTVDLATDERAERYGSRFPARDIHVIASATVRARDPISLARTATMLGVGALQAYRLLGRIRPAAVVGFGGYPTVPPVLAAALRGIPTLIHEQNAVMGRANRLLAPRVRAIALSFAGVLDREPKLAAKATRTGNPVRPAVIAAAAAPYAPPDPAGPLRLLVFGGSQGARIMSDIVPPAIERLAPQLRARLAIVQQAREEDLGRVKETYARAKVTAEVATFFTDLPARIAGSPSRRGAFRRLDGGRAGGDRPARHPGAAAARARSGPGRQCRRARAGRRGDPATAGGVHARAAGGRDRRACQRAAKARSNGRRGPRPGRGRRRRAARGLGVEVAGVVPPSFRDGPPKSALPTSAHKRHLG